MSGENIKLTCSLCHEFRKMVLSVLFLILSHTLKKYEAPPNVAVVIYGLCIEMEIVSCASTHLQLGPVKIAR